MAYFAKIKFQLFILTILAFVSVTKSTSIFWTLSSTKKYEGGKITQTFCIRKDRTGTYLWMPGYFTPNTYWAYDVKLIGSGPKYGYKDIEIKTLIGDSVVVTGGYIILDTIKTAMEISLKVGKKKAAFVGNGKHDYNW